jgi:hypothetical protein
LFGEGEGLTFTAQQGNETQGSENMKLIQNFKSVKLKWPLIQDGSGLVKVL